MAIQTTLDEVEQLLTALETLNPRFRLMDISLYPVLTNETGRSVSFVVDERYDVSFHSRRLVDALRIAYNTILTEPS